MTRNFIPRFANDFTDRPGEGAEPDRNVKHKKI